MGAASARGGWESQLYPSYHLEVGFDGKEELVDEDTFEGGDIVLLIKHQHRLLIVNRINCSEGYGTVAVG